MYQRNNIIDTKNQTNVLNAVVLSVSGGRSGPARDGFLNSLLKGRFGGMYTFIAFFVSACFLLRTGLLIHSFSLVDHNVSALIKIYAVGFFFDVITSFLAVIPVAIYLTVVPDKMLRWKPSR